MGDQPRGDPAPRPRGQDTAAPRRGPAAGCSWRSGCRYNNGLRPEPIIALGLLLTWCSVERAVATSRLLPAAIACIIGAFTLFSGPTGIAAIGALLVAIGPLQTIVRRRIRVRATSRCWRRSSPRAPSTIFLIFRDQTLAAELQASCSSLLSAPACRWFDEHIRYERLFMATPDGSVARRFARARLLVALAFSVAMIVAARAGFRAPRPGPRRRIIGIPSSRP